MTLDPDDEETRALSSALHAPSRVEERNRLARLQLNPQRDPGEGICAVEQVIKEFHDIDRYATAFRYSTNRNGTRIDLPDIRIDLENLQQVMEGVNNFFQGADGMLIEFCANAPYGEG